MAWISEKHADLLADKTRAFACLATLMKDGSPQLTPIWFNTDGKYILLNSAEGRIKDQNMRRDARIALVILDPKNPYRYIQLRGRVVEITSNGARQHIDSLAKKYHGVDKYTSGSAGEIRVMYKFLPDKITEH